MSKTNEELGLKKLTEEEIRRVGSHSSARASSCLKLIEDFRKLDSTAMKVETKSPEAVYCSMRRLIKVHNIKDVRVQGLNGEVVLVKQEG